MQFIYCYVGHYAEHSYVDHYAEFYKAECHGPSNNFVFPNFTLFSSRITSQEQINFLQKCSKEFSLIFSNLVGIMLLAFI